MKKKYISPIVETNHFIVDVIMTSAEQIQEDFFDLKNWENDLPVLNDLEGIV